MASDNIKEASFLGKLALRLSLQGVDISGYKWIQVKVGSKGISFLTPHHNIIVWPITRRDNYKKHFKTGM